MKKLILIALIALFVLAACAKPSNVTVIGKHQRGQSYFLDVQTCVYNPKTQHDVCTDSVLQVTEETYNLNEVGQPYVTPEGGANEK